MRRSGTLPREPVDALCFLCGVHVFTVRHLCWAHRAVGGRWWRGGGPTGACGGGQRSLMSLLYKNPAACLPHTERVVRAPLPLCGWGGGLSPPCAIVPPPPYFYHTCRRRGLDQPPRVGVSTKSPTRCRFGVAGRGPLWVVRSGPLVEDGRTAAVFAPGDDWAGAVQIGEAHGVPQRLASGQPVALEPLASHRGRAPARPPLQPVRSRCMGQPGGGSARKIPSEIWA